MKLLSNYQELRVRVYMIDSMIVRNDRIAIIRLKGSKAEG